jgi:hypothetical protein
VAVGTAVAKRRGVLVGPDMNGVGVVMRVGVEAGAVTQNSVTMGCSPDLA